MNHVCKIYQIAIDFFASENPNVRGWLGDGKAELVNRLKDQTKAHVGRSETPWGYLARCIEKIDSGLPSEWEWEIDHFMIAAFKDLSPIKDPLARKLFEKLCHIFRFGKGELRGINIDSCIIWDRSCAQPRSDGSIVWNLHVSHPMIFQNILENGMDNCRRNGQIPYGAVLRCKSDR